MYEKIRKFAIYFFIVCMVVVTIVVIGAIWGWFAKDAIGKSFGSLAILVLSAALIGVATLIREGKANFSTTTSVPVAGVAGAPAPVAPTISVGRVILYVVLILIAIPFLLAFIGAMVR